MKDQYLLANIGKIVLKKSSGRIFSHNDEGYRKHDLKPAMKLTSPANPMTVDQLPEDVRKNIKHLPINF